MKPEDTQNLTNGQTVYYTKYVLTKGILESRIVNMERFYGYNGYLAIEDKGAHSNYALVDLEDLHLTLNDAFNRFETLKEKRLKQLIEQQIKIQTLTASALKVTDITATEY